MLNSVQIGAQKWSVENLDVTHFSNGDPILEIRDNDEWLKCFEKKVPAFCHIDNDPNNTTEFGLLYNFYAVHDPRGLAPTGWRIPSKEDWDELRVSVEKTEQSGPALRTKTGWDTKEPVIFPWEKMPEKSEWEDGNGNDSLSFGALPAGYRTPGDGEFSHRGEAAIFWSSTQVSEVNTTIWAYFLLAGGSTLDRMGYNQISGLSVRCMKD